MVRPTADLASGAAAAGAALSPASARVAAAQKTDINQRRDGAGMESSPSWFGAAPDSKRIVRLPPGTAKIAPY
jgi:hypothetical protein